MNMKYLADGRKVAIVGQINQTEFIVQEIFVTKDGDEIPQGEKFTTKTLLDQPLVSYAEKRRKEEEATTARYIAQKESVAKELTQIQEKLKGYRELFKQVKLLADNIPSQKFDVLCRVMSGSIKYVAVVHYSGVKILPFDEAVFTYENEYGRKSFESIRLISLLGRSDGNTEFRLHQYYDGSGSGYDRVEFFDTMSDAVAFAYSVAKETISKGDMSLDKLKSYQALGVVFTDEEIRGVAEKAIEQNKKSLENHIATNAKTYAALMEKQASCEELLK